ncbi:MAG: hypothetical protein M4579_001171 [Chaenotheca gracillima]|nr:MAG: hypothetical protein M4579_001171 [Chaenotheca gracillima]
MAERIRVLFGTAAAASWSPETTKEFFSLLKKHGVNDLDTAHLYVSSEKTLGDLGAPKDFTMHTKFPGFVPGSLSKSSIAEGAKKSLSELKTDSVETYFLHSPDTQTPIEETLDAVQEQYAAGKFKYFGLSNYKPEDVQKIHDYNSSKGYVLPTVYQGNYNPVARGAEAELFPLLRKLGIRFYAYSPLAGGFLVKSSAQFKDNTLEKGGRFDAESMVGQLYNSLYKKPSLLNALTEWEDVAREAGVSKSALAYRWVTYHSALKKKYGDGIILGASKGTQLEETLKAIDAGPLDSKTVSRIDKLWDSVKDEAPLDNYNG